MVNIHFRRPIHTTPEFQLKPLVACMRVALVGGILAGVIEPAQAELPVPVQGQGWVSSGSATQQIIGNTLKIDQKSDKAILNWQKFNVGKDKKVQFVQPGSSSIALNRIHQQDPSKIFGKIVANGQVYLYNKNGFVFGKDSSVNTNSLIATTLNISDEVFERGVTRVFDDNGKAALEIEPMQPGDLLDPKTAKILIEAGAKIHTDKAGRIIIAAPTIENHGSVTSEAQGQVIMTASQDKVYLQAADKDSPFAGLLVEVDTGGKVENTGNILAKQGNVTLAGFAVNQQGRINATTSVNVNGSIRLLAKEKVDLNSKKLLSTNTERETALDDGLGKAAKVTLGGGSVTQVVADANGGSAIDEQQQPDSLVEITGNKVELQAGSKIRVPGGKVKVTATDNLLDPISGSKGRLFIDKKASIDVSGYKNVAVDMERNVGEISAQSYELRDAPLQRDGVLRGKDLRVDLRKDTQIVDVSGAKARISRDIKERLAKGGEITLTSSGDMLVNDGAKLDISGGSVKYRDGFINTTQLFDQYGRMVDISDADPNEKYRGFSGEIVEKYQKWGVEKIWKVMDVFGQGNFEKGYVEGKQAGGVNIVTPRLAWGGVLKAGTTAGPYQRGQSDLPFGGSFNVDMSAFQSTQNVRFQNAATPVNLESEQDFPLNDTQKAADLVLLTDVINASKVGEFSLKTWGSATVDANSQIKMKPGGKLAIEATDIAFDGHFKSAGGAISLKTTVQGDTGGDQSGQAGRLEVGSHATLDVSGVWVNDLHPVAGDSPSDALAIQGGSVALAAEGDLWIKSGSVISADGGAWLPFTGKLQAGKGGSIALAAKGNASQPSKLTLDGKVTAYGLEQNGSLTLESGTILLGTPTEGQDVSQTLVLGVSNGNFDFSQQLAFSTMTLRANFADLTVTSDVNLDLRQKNWVLPDNYLQVAGGKALRSFSKIGELAEYLRKPTGLNLVAASGVKQAQGSSISVDKGGAINLSTQAGNVYVDGVLQAQGGAIGLSIKPSNGLEYDPAQAIWLGQHAQLLAQGATRYQPKDVFGYRNGEVLDGGQIVFDAQRGMLVTETGSLLDVSGIQAKLHILKDSNSQVPEYQQKNIASNAGVISMTAAEGIILNGKMRAFAGSSATHGGKLAMTLDRSQRNPPEEPKVPFPSHPLMLNITQSARRSLEDDFVLGDAFPDAVNGQATLVADQLDAGGFTRLDLASKDQVVFVGNVKLSAAERINIDAPVIRGVEDGTIELDTAFLQIGSSFNRNIANSAELGGAKFTAHAQWIQLQGATQWHGFSQLTLNSEHDLRTLGLRNEDEQRDYVGALVTAADLYLQASQIYPTTLSDFSFLVKNNPEGRIVITGTNSDKSPLSAAGSLTFEAAQIIQQGVLKAPFGTITLKAANSLTLAEGSLTSVSAAGSSIPFGVTQGGLDWLYPLDNLNNLVFKAAPEKRLILSAAEIDVAAGSVVDVSGGGNLLSYEFQPGAGGSFDYLQPGSAAYQGGFAILPSLGSQLAPYDHFESQSWAFEPGSSVYLSGVEGLAAGEYAILPAHYALLKGAYLVTPIADTQDFGVTQKTVDGRSIITGYFTQAGSKIRDARSSGFLIENGADVRLRAEYDVQNANDFYQNQAKQRDTAVPVLPMDGGQISLIAQTKLIMEGDFMMDAISGGKGAKMDIAANRIVVADQFSATPIEGTLEILADDLSALNVESLLLGGARTRDNQSGETAIQVSSQQVVFSGNTQLKGAEILAVATDLVEVQEGVSIESDRLADTGDSVLNVVGDGALLRVSGAEQVVLNRTETSGTAGVLRLAAGSALKASGSMLLDGSLSTELQGDLAMQGGSLNLAASSINIGEVDDLGGAALNLSNQKLAHLAVDELVLTGRDSVGVYGTVGQVDANGEFLLGEDGLPKALEFERLLINSAGLIGHGTTEHQARLKVGTLGLSNSAATTNQQLVDGQGQLELNVDNLEIGDGSFALQGFSAVKINAVNQIRAVGQGNLKVGGKLQAATAAFTADGGAKLNINATGYQADFAHLTGKAVVESGYAGAIAVVADAINFNTQVILPSGQLNLQALTGDLSLGEQAKLDLAGRAVQFADQKQYMPGGSFKAVTPHGKLSFAVGSSIDLDSAGGDAAGGNLILQAPEKTLELSGQLQNAKGSVLVEVAEFAEAESFDALMQKFATAGINQSIYFRTRQADIQQGAASTIIAKEVTLVSDTGAINLAGQVNADATDAGGSIKLFAGDRIALNGAQLSAMGKNVGAKGGAVLLSSVDNDEDGDSGIAIAANSLIDVAGNNAEGGIVTLRALRTANAVNIQPIAGQIRGHKALYAEAVKKYGNADLGNDGRIDSADINKIQSEAAEYMTAARMLNVTETMGQGIRLLPGVEINVSGDLLLQDKWDLLAWRYDEDSDSNVWDDLPGRLAIRTDGNFTLQQSLSDGFKNENFEYVDEQGVKKSISVYDRLQNGASWSYQLVAGSDLHSADPGVAAAQKNLTVGSNVRIRTGTGNIQLNAGGDIVIAAGEVIDNKVGGTSGASAAKDSITLPVADIEKWKVGGYLSGNGIAPGTFIVAIDTSKTSYKTSAAIIKGSLSLQVGEDFSGWKEGDYLSGNGIDKAVIITRVDATGTSNTLAANVILNSQALQLVDTNGWVVGDVIAGEGFATDSVITSIDMVGISKTSSAQAIKNSLALRVSNTTGWVVGDYLSGAGLADDTVISSIDTVGVTQSVSAAVAKNSTTLKVANLTGWVVGDTLSGTGIANNTVITAINTSTKTVTLSDKVTVAIAVNAKLKTLPSIHLSKATVEQVSVSANIKSLPSVHISKAVNKVMTSDNVITTLPSVHLSKPVTLAIAKNANISSMPYVTLSSPLTLAATANSKITATYTPGSIYSAGTNSISLPYGSLSNRAVALFFNSQYPVNGGDVSLTAAGNIQGTVSSNDFNDWLLRIGEWSETNPVQPTAWGVGLGYIPGSKSNTQPGRSALPLFQQNLAAFGGGKVAVKAGGDIKDLEVVMPTTGKQIGDANGSFNLNGFLSNQVEIQGGGGMQIMAGGNVAGGSYYLGQGQGSMTVGGELLGGSQYLNGPALLLGDSRFSIQANQNINLSAVTDPMIAHRGDVNFFSYSEDSGLDLASLSGDVFLRANGTLFVDSNKGNQQSLAAIFPASLQATAFGGSIQSTSEVALFPSAIGELSLFAEQDITAADIGNRVGMSDADTMLLPTPEAPLANSDMSTVVGRLDPFGLPVLTHVKTPLHSNDDQPARLVTRQGDITNIEFSIAKRALIKSGHDIVNLSLLLQHVNADDITLLEAGRDISYTSERNVKSGALLDNTAKIQVGGPGDVLIKSGRNTDLGASEGISTVGNVINTNLASTGAKLTLMVGLNGTAPDYLDFMSNYQPGSSTLQSVIDVVEGMPDFANKSGMLVSLKNLHGMSAELRSNYLIDLGSDLQAMIDQPKQILLEQLTAKNLLKLGSPNNSELSKQITEIKQKIDALETLALQTDLLEKGSKLIGEFMRGYTGNADLTHAEAKQLFKSLKQEAYLPIQSKLDLLVTPVLFKEIKHAGSASALDKSAGNASGYAAIDSLFPGKEWQGNLSMFFSKIHTVDGGDIDLLVPGGEVNTGLAVSFSGSKEASELGIVAQRQGSINAMVNDDFLVNTSRVFSLDGSDILIWSSEGDVDAGRGAKSAIAAPPPIISFDDDGNMVIEFPPIVSGSGIRTAASSEGVTPGDVYLFAPKGVVDAGEAGIGGSNVTISATAVLGASNIQVSGVGTGVPVASTGSLAAGLTGASNLSSGVSQMAESAVNNDVAKDTASKALAKAVLGILSVEILGFGE